MEEAKLQKKVRRFIRNNCDRMSNAEMFDKMEKKYNVSKSFFAGQRRSVTCEMQGMKKVKKVEKVERENGENFANYGGNGKTSARKIMAKAIKRSKIYEGKVLSLPAARCLLESKIKEEVSACFDFVGCEVEESTFKKMKSNAKKLGLRMVAHYGAISDIIETAEPNEYSHLLLDYCDSLKTIVEDLHVVMTNNIMRVGGVLALTFSQRGNKKGFIENFCRFGCVDNTKSDTFNAVHNFIRLYNGYEIEKSFSYRDTTPMMLVIIKRHK